MPLQATSGAASYDAFGGGVPVVPAYIEEVFSTYLYAGNNSTQTITNGIDLSGKGGLVWTKARVDRYHNLEDTVRGAGNSLWSNASSANYYYSDAITSFGSTGYTLGADATGDQVNANNTNYVSWTFRKQPKFFDVVTYTGNGTNGRTVAHSLGSTPGCMIVKRTDASNGWAVYHRAMNASPQDYMMRLNATDGAFTTSPSRWNNTLPTSTEFTLSGNDEVNGSGATYVAYIFAHNAGGFGLTGTDNVISCGRLTSGGAPATVNLGYEVQWLLTKELSSGFGWNIYNNMEGMSVTGAKFLQANTSGAELTDNTYFPYPTATGFGVTDSFSNDMIYIAIRRGPMKVPTSGTSVFSPQVQTPTGATNYVMAGSSGFPIDWLPTKQKDTVVDWYQTSRLTNNYMSPNTTAAEGAYTYGFDLMQGVSAQWNTNSTVSYAFRRAPNFFDVVCYTGDGTGQTIYHNLGVVPEMMIFKTRTGATRNWGVYAASIGTGKKLWLNATNAVQNDSFFVPSTPTATILNQGNADETDEGGNTYVAYLFATCAGVSKVGSYTGTGTTKQVDCGFTGGARFVLIKRTDSTGDWYVWDTARGIVAGNDPYLLLNSTAAEVTNTDYVDTYSAGFEISSTAPAAINASGGTFIFLAIA